MTAPLPQAPVILQDLSPEVAALLVSLGLVGPAAPFGADIVTLGEDLKKRQAPGLLEDPSPSVAALVASLSLVAPAAPLGAVVATVIRTCKPSILANRRAHMEFQGPAQK
jgi:hypothetical protein